jgi:hypothetical protein
MILGNKIDKGSFYENQIEEMRFGIEQDCQAENFTKNLIYSQCSLLGDVQVDSSMRVFL